MYVTLVYGLEKASREKRRRGPSSLFSGVSGSGFSLVIIKKMWNIMLRKLFNTFQTQKSQVCKHWRSSAVAFKINNMCTDAMNTDSLSPEDKEKILQVINSTNTEDILQYSITKKRAQNLESHRANNGPYNSLEDLLQVKGISNKCLNKFFNSIICDKRKSPRKLTRGLVLAPETTNQQKDVSTILGIYIGLDMISWSLLNRDYKVLQWNYECFSQNILKENIHSLLQITLPLAAKLPKADRYVLQEIVNSMGYSKNWSLYQSYVQESVLTAIVLSYLATSNSEFNNTTDFMTNNVIILRQCVLPKIYGLIVDNEAIATKYVMEKLLQESGGLMKTKEHLSSISIKTEFRSMYNAQSPVHQEQISWSLLIALAFLELVVHQKTDMSVRSDV